MFCIENHEFCDESDQHWKSSREVWINEIEYDTDASGDNLVVPTPAHISVHSNTTSKEIPDIFLTSNS